MGLCNDLEVQGFAAPFQISHPSVAGLLSQHTMKIPELQRYYAWGELEARELCADLRMLLESLRAGRPDPQHFFGTLVAVLHAGQRDDVVDGQQRMTTVTLLLGQIRASFLRLHQECMQIAQVNAGNQAVVDHHTAVAQIAEASANQLQSWLFVNRGFTANGQVVWEPRLEVTPEITETYRSLIDGGQGEVASENLMPAAKLREVAGVFERELVEDPGFSQKAPRKKFDHLNELMTVVGNGLIIVRLATTNADSAYDLFESLNARGVPLNALDHLKVWMLSVFAQEQINGSQVAQQMRDLANDDPKEQINFFQHYYEARSQDNRFYNGMDAPKKLVAEARRSVFRDPKRNGMPDVMSLTDRIEHEVGYMTTLYPIWRKLQQGQGEKPFLPSFFEGSSDETWIRNRLELLLGNVLRHQKAYPYLMVAADRLRQQPAQFGDLIHLLERFFFRYKTICGGSESSIAALYNSLLLDLDANSGFNMDLVRDRIRGLIESLAPDTHFRAGLVNKLGYSNQAPRKNRTKYFFQMLDEYCYQQKPKKRQIQALTTEWHLEHIVPQNPKPGDPSLAEDEVHSIGNLCLLPPWINEKLSNLSYSDKQTEAKRLRDLPVPQKVKIDLADPEEIFYLGNSTVWTTSDVTSRITKLQDFACEVFRI